ncbi:helix-turn-helix domain-containing protein [Demequina aurantiaca]|uniref:helix-turn-helix domain-containing protein n=1 Tax=Demequina aurantiaca TaxID=676200 RepID=UPI00078076F2|nr:helix-turn-helix domain-containing protein [Demequina aurantiaca]
MNTAIPTHLVASPGAILDEWLDERNMSQRDLADRIDKSEKFVSQLINGKATLSDNTAHDLELITQVSAESWLRMEGAYRAARKRTAAIAEAATAESPVEAQLMRLLRSCGVITAPRGNRGEQAIQVYEFLGVTSASALAHVTTRRAAAFRTSNAFTPDPVATEVTLALSRRQADHLTTSPIDLDRVRDCIGRIPPLTLEQPARGAIAAREMLAHAGVALVFLPNVPKAHCNGVTLWDNDRVIVAITDRGKREDIWWFTLLHELCHVLEGPTDAIYINGGSTKGQGSEAELRADAFATDTLIPPEKAHLLELVQTFADLEDVANRLGVSPGIAVGQLHHRRLKPYSWGNDYLRRVEVAV